MREVTKEWRVWSCPVLAIQPLVVPPMFLCVLEALTNYFSSKVMVFIKEIFVVVWKTVENTL